jgi:NADPH-dependent curcumin reductase CurA
MPWLLCVQDVAAVLAAEYPQGVDVVYEGVGGQLRAAIMQHLAPNARVLQVMQGLCHKLQLA